ncbi:ParA family protein, partial [Salmonella enterica subsp. enterica serovar Istanbul]|nr:ParA family protein [Salmonella enterica subsp. enterica serovar Istanbul]
MTATVLSFANFKGGVGKTSTTALVAWSLTKA